MTTVTALFDSYGDADRAASKLGARGFRTSEVGALTSESAVTSRGIEDILHVPHDAADGAEEGAIVGGLAGLLVGVGALALPGVGPLFAAGVLGSIITSTLAGASYGAMTGGLLGALTAMGVPESVAESYSEGVKGNGVVVSVTTNRPDEAEEILRSCNGNDIHRSEIGIDR